MTTLSSSDPAPVATPAVVPQLPVTLDTKGRVRTTKDQRRVILAEFERSGMSAARFAQQTGLKYPTLAGWLQRYLGPKRQRRTGCMRLLEAVVDQAIDPGAPNAMSLVLELAGGARVQISNVDQAILAAALLRALEKPC